MNTEAPTNYPEPEETASRFRNFLLNLGFPCLHNGRTIQLDNGLDHAEIERLLRLIRHARLTDSAPDVIEETPVIRITDSAGTLLYRSQPIMAELMMEILKSSRLSKDIEELYRKRECSG